MNSRTRAPNFMKSEETLLLRLAKEHSSVINNKACNSIVNTEKSLEWEKIARKFNLQNKAGVPRDSFVLRRKYENIKKARRRQIAATEGSQEIDYGDDESQFMVYVSDNEFGINECKPVVVCNDIIINNMKKETEDAETVGTTENPGSGLIQRQSVPDYGNMMQPESSSQSESFFKPAYNYRARSVSPPLSSDSSSNMLQSMISPISDASTFQLNHPPVIKSSCSKYGIRRQARHTRIKGKQACRTSRRTTCRRRAVLHQQRWIKEQHLLKMQYMNELHEKQIRFMEEAHQQKLRMAEENHQLQMRHAVEAHDLARTEHLTKMTMLRVRE